MAASCRPEAGVACLVGWRLMEATSTRPLLSIAEGMTIMLPSLCMLLPAGLLARELLFRAPKIPLPCPYALLTLGFSTASTSIGRGMLAWSCIHRQIGERRHVAVSVLWLWTNGTLVRIRLVKIHGHSWEQGSSVQCTSPLGHSPQFVLCMCHCCHGW